MTTKSAKRKPPKDEETIGTYASFRRAIHARGKLVAGLEEARPKLIPAAIPTIVAEAADTPIYRNAIVREPFPKSIHKLKQKRPLPVAGDLVEAAWTASILSLFNSELCLFIRMRDRYHAAIATSDYKAALDALDQLQQELGFSLWLISARIALLQTHEGTPAQKRFLQGLLSVKGVSGATGYLSYLFGFTAEENVSLAELTREWGRQEAFKLSEDTIHYFRYHISAFSLSQVERPWQCVAHEENSAIVDRFETFAEMSALAYVRADSPEDANYIRDAACLLREIPDRRIQNLVAIFQGTMTSTGCDAAQAGIAAMLMPDGGAIREDLVQAIERTPLEFSLHESAARLGIKSGTPVRLEEKYTLANSLIKQFEDVVGLSENYHESRFALQKTALIHRNSPVARSIISFLNKEDDRIISNSSTEDEGLWAISSSIADPEQLPIWKQLNDVTAAPMSAAVAQASTLFSVTDAVVFPSSNSASVIRRAPISSVDRMLYEGHLAFNQGNSDEALERYLQYRASVKGAEQTRATRLVYEAAHAREDLKLALQVVTQSYLESTASRLVFPLEQVAQWAKENTGLDSTCLDRAITLNIYLQHVSPKHDGDLSDAFEDVLEFFDVDKPSSLLFKLSEDGADRARWIYFLREVATIRRLEDGTQLRNYEAIEAERLDVLNGLMKFCPELTSELADEVIALTQEREVAQLAEQFDRSRIYVSETGVKQFIEVELRDVVARYRRVVDAPGLQEEIARIEGILLKILKSAGDEYKAVTLPATEEEDLLHAIYGLVADAFVLNPDHGLKTYLTTRILHGSIEGELRSSFARHQLLFPSALETEFDDAWKSRLRLGHSDYMAARSAALRFSRRVTDAIKELKDKRIRIVSKETPNGLFDFSPTVRDIISLREEVKSLRDVEEVANVVISRLWRKVEASLKLVKKEIEGDFRRRISQAAENLRSTLASIAAASETDRIQDALTTSITEFQTSLDRVLAWFTRSGTASVKPFTVETAVRVATRLTNSRFPNDPIAPEIVIDQPMSIRGTAFSPLLDILRNCFQNIIEHGAIAGRAPPTVVKCETTEGGFRFQVANVLPTQHDRKQILRAVEMARSGVRPVTSTRAGRGTGLREIERVLAQEGCVGTTLDVDVNDDGRFTISFSIRG
ncbi:hypothetical protein [Bradyrhizobium sp. S3.3.6]|uniref:hypothetical protein n=1 Tax=Bradyrhizobium sp. S3.3.6 TaxID=3156429 RepID=UPI0033955013